MRISSLSGKYTSQDILQQIERFWSQRAGLHSTLKWQFPPEEQKCKVNRGLHVLQQLEEWPAQNYQPCAARVPPYLILLTLTLWFSLTPAPGSCCIWQISWVHNMSWASVLHGMLLLHFSGSILQWWWVECTVLSLRSQLGYTDSIRQLNVYVHVLCKYQIGWDAPSQKRHCLTGMFHRHYH